MVRELLDRLGVVELLDALTVKKRRPGYSPAQAILGLCETLIAGGECLDDVVLLRADPALELLRGHGLPEPTTLGRFLRRLQPLPTANTGTETANRIPAAHAVLGTAE